MACTHTSLHSIYELVGGGFGAVCAYCGDNLSFSTMPTLHARQGPPLHVKARLLKFLSAVRFRDWKFHIGFDDTRPYLQIESPDDGGWTSRKWFLSPHMTRSEVVQTAFKAVLTALEHEAREAFRYKGCAVYSPHYDVERLVELHGSGAALEVRPDS